MIQIKTITEYLNQEFPIADQEDWDNCGLLIGYPYQEVTSALLCVDVTEEIVEEATRLKCGLIISHHPLIFGGLKRITGKTYVERIVQNAIKNNIAIYAIHTNLDNHINGLNYLLASKLGLSNLKILRPKPDMLRKIVTFCPPDHAEKVRNAIFEAGAGRIGNYDSCSYNSLGEGSFRANANADPFTGEIDKLHFEKEVKIEAIYPVYLEQQIIAGMIKAHPYEEVAYDIMLLGNKNTYRGSGIIGNIEPEILVYDFFEKVKKVCGLPLIKYNGNLDNRVATIALCGGSGSFLIRDAMKAGAQVFLTADLKYHDYFLPEGKMVLGDIGHYESEQFSKDLIAQVLMKKFPNFAALKTNTNSNPVKYL
jgi:dinuclear metal center YbgI/SA1388 family protein